MSVSHLSEMRNEIEGGFERGLFDREFYRQRLNFYEFDLPSTLPDSKSLIVVSVPRPQAQATFTYGGRTRGLIIPPTYVANQRTRDEVRGFLNGVLGGRGYRVAPPLLPLKLLAVRSGLAEYGRNNITYVPGMGSFHQVVVFFSDLPCTQDSWRQERMMARCQGCEMCRVACPTGAIPLDRFVLRAERCIVFHNEKKGDVPFPAWIDPSWHNCLIGCLRCQRVCPENKPFLNWIVEKQEFSPEETDLLLGGDLFGRIPPSTLAKLRSLDQDDPESLSSLPRNLRVFFPYGES